MHHIGAVAEAVGLSIPTIRYWDEIDLVPPSGRSPGGFRLYTDADVDRLRVVMSMRPLDLSIEEKRDLLSMTERLADPKTSERDRAALAERLAMFAALAEESCQRLRAQIASAEALSATLRAEVIAYSNAL